MQVRQAILSLLRQLMGPAAFPGNSDCLQRISSIHPVSRPVWKGSQMASGSEKLLQQCILQVSELNSDTSNCLKSEHLLTSNIAQFPGTRFLPTLPIFPCLGWSRKQLCATPSRLDRVAYSSCPAMMNITEMIPTIPAQPCGPQPCMTGNGKSISVRTQP